ncbi:DeoR/GlpR family DNA-binding transcription regulator [Sagittula sp. S175]|uniref:DeoR/GlpR family DNA-binding transcription regulator n=1 Tax=Sagittula sp. S175 TaxID=3415129 RepID=UPI003C7D15CA
MDLAEIVAASNVTDGPPQRLRKTERREQILLELKLRPHVRIAELAERFNVSTETVRRDFDALADDGLVARAHGGATAPGPGQYPGLNERAIARTAERERIGQRAAQLVRDGETLMVDSGSTTIQFARALSLRGTPCTVITNSIPVAMTLAHGAQQILLCPGEYLSAESAVVGSDTLAYLSGFHVDHCMIGATGLTEEGPSETVRGFAAVKRAMLVRARKRHLLLDSRKFGRKGLALVGRPDEIDSLVADQAPDPELTQALTAGGVELLLAT